MNSSLNGHFGAGKVFSLEEVENVLKELSTKKKNEVVILKNESNLTPEKNVKKHKNKKMKKTKNAVMNEEYIKACNSELKDFLEKIETSALELQQRTDFFVRLQKYISTKIKGTLFQFGSAANGFGMRNMDMDLCLITRSKEEKETIIENLGSYLKESKDYEVLNILSKTRIPIVRLKDLKTEILADIGINNHLALRNTELLKEYAKIDSRVAALGKIIKYWAKQRNLNDTFKGTLSSYAYNIMLIHFLQRIKVVPNLQKNAKSHLIENWETGFKNNFTWQSKNQKTLFEILADFFHYFAKIFDVKAEVISIQNSYVTKEQKQWTLNNNDFNCKYWMCIEDPFDLSHNLSRGVTKNDLYDIKGEFRRADRLIKKETSIQNIFENYLEKNK